MSATEIKSFYDVPGFFWWLDRMVFAAALREQSDDPPGDLCELGVYLGRSSVIVGDFVRPNERFVVVDLFGSTDDFTDSSQDQANRAENDRSYHTLTRQKFEANYLALHDDLPEVYQEPSSRVVEHLGESSVRFLHIDASHLYHFVAEDVRNAKWLLRPGGLVVFDDYRSAHTPGVSAAVWQAVFSDGLIPVAITPMKMYAVYDAESVDRYARAIEALVRDDARLKIAEQDVMGRRLLLVNMADGTQKKPAATATVTLTDESVAAVTEALSAKIAASVSSPARSADAEQPTGDAAPRPGAAEPARPRPSVQASTGRRVLRKVARDYSPPALTRAVVSVKRRATRPRVE